MKVGITGHQELNEPSSWGWVSDEIDNLLDRLPKPIIGISSLAAGADQLFAAAVVRHGGALEVVVPFDEYAQQFEDEHARAEYQRLLCSASAVEVLPGRATVEESYLAAGQRVVDLADQMVAVWDGEPAVGLGGTADIVEYARHVGKLVTHLNPVDRERSGSKELLD